MIMVFTLRRTLTRLTVSIFAALALCLATTHSAFAAYNCGVYGAGAYDTNTCSTTDNLTNTGQSLLPFIIPALLILAGAIVLYRTRRKMKARRSAS